MTDGSEESFSAKPLHRLLGGIVHIMTDDGEDDGSGGGSGGTEGGGIEISVAIAAGPGHKSLESPRID